MNCQSVGAPLNFITTQAHYGQPRSGNSYAGISNFPAGAYPFEAEFREYVALEFEDALPSATYYVEFYSRLAQNSGRTLPTLGVWLGYTWDSLNYYVQYGPNPLYKGVMRDIPGTRLVPQVTRRDGNLNDTSRWVRTAGCLPVTALTTGLIVGCFRPDTVGLFGASPFAAQPNTFYEEAYYLIDDVALRAFPTAGLPDTLTCHYATVLGAGCPLPPSSGAVYLWYGPGAGPPTGSPLSVSTTTASLVLDITSAAGTYTLAVRVPHPDRVYNATDPTSYYQAQSTTTVTAGPVLPVVQAGGPYTFYDDGQPHFLDRATPPGGEWESLSSGFGFVDSGTGEIDTTGLVPGAYVVKYYLTTGPSGCLSQAIDTVYILPVREGCLINAYDGAVEVLGNMAISGGYTFKPELVYHLTGDVILENADYVLPYGCTLLFDRDVNLIVGYNATLYLHGATLTAACNDMWGAVVLRPDCNGLYADYNRTSTSATISLPRNDLTVGLTDEFDPLANHIRHSRHGIVVDRPDLTQVYLTETEFAHNRVSLYARPRHPTGNWPTAPGPATALTVIRCRFTSDSAEFKQPLLHANARSEAHLHLGAWTYDRASRIQGNRFDNALVGILNDSAALDGVLSMALPLGPDPDGPAPAQRNIFTRCLLAGVFLEHPLDYDARLTGNLVEFDSLHYRPNSGQQRAFLASDPAKASVLPHETYGFVVNGEPLVKDNEFRNARLTPSFTQPRPQTGVHSYCVSCPAGELRIENNTFENLGDGVMLYAFGLIPFDISGNLFLNNHRGLRFGYDEGYSAGARVTCNTFVRTHWPTSGTGPVGGGDSYGIYLDSGATVQLGGLAQAANTINKPSKNLFVEDGGFGFPASTAYHVFKPDAAPDSSLYYTFRTGHFNYQTVRTGGKVRAKFNVGNPAIVAAYALNNGTTCLTDEGFSNGIQLRITVAGIVAGGTDSDSKKDSVVSLAQNFPNPFATETTVQYRLPATVTVARLLVHECVTGRVVWQQNIALNATTALLRPTGLTPGLYAYTLLVDGRPAATRRFLIANS